MGKASILVVDDEAGIRSALVQWFALLGYEVESAADGVEAVELCGVRRFDVITMDLEMPRMGGIEAIRAIRAHHGATPILVVTGMPRRIHEALAAGATKILMKPLHLRELENEVRLALAGGETA
ncbi:MAG: response regulator [Candidatus Hydrogenedentes bacterium]|nr:response regulator [Candidatus Hydrogenedentota bacterium]